MTKSYSLEEGLQVAIDYANEPTEKGITIMIGATDVEDVRKKLEEHTYEVIENSEEVLQKIQASQEKVVFLDKNKDEEHLSLVMRQDGIRKCAKKHGVNVYILVELPKRIENRYAKVTDFKAFIEATDMMFGVTNAGVNQLKNRFGHTGVIA